jgi:PAS domain S-box-containing protein
MVRVGGRRRTVSMPGPGTGLLAVCAVAAAGLSLGGVAADRDAPLIVAGVLLLGVCALVAVYATERWRRMGRRAGDDAARLVGVIDEIGEIVTLRDREGRYLLVNRQFEQLAGVVRADVLGHTDHELFPAAADATRAGDLKALAQGAPLQTQDIVTRVDGPHTYFTVRHPVVGRDGRPDVVCGISTDITDLMRAEDQVRRLIADLEQRVRRRTAELEATTRELDAFTYSVSHDLRTPLRAITGFVEILVEDHATQLDAAGREHLRRVHAAAERMGHLIEALLELSHAGRSELVRRPVDLGGLARDVVAELRAAEPHREVDMVIEKLPASGDTRLLGLVMQNLVSNAWKFTAERADARIGVGTRDEGDERVFYVEDNGAGFDMRYAEKLFTPFQRLHSTERFPGTGIGLAIVERIVARHGGRVWARGVPGQGATFLFTLGSPEPDGGDMTVSGG